MTLTAAEQKTYEDLFRKHDKDGNGVLSIQEILPIYRELGWSEKKYPNSTICKWFVDSDKDNSRTIDFKEFINAVNIRPRAELNEANLRRVFKEFDQDGSGAVSASELKQALAKCDIKISDSQANDMIREADKSGDGQIDVEEFLAVFNK